MTSDTNLEPILIDACELARLLGISVRSVHRFRSAGKLPRSVQVCGSSKVLRWRRAEVIAWVDAGMPLMKSWETKR